MITIQEPKPTPCWYDKRNKELQGSQISKAKRFVKEGLIIAYTPFDFEVCPIRGYNKSTYSVKYDGAGRFSCDCQFFVKTGKECSHILAVELYVEQKRSGDEI